MLCAPSGKTTNPQPPKDAGKHRKWHGSRQYRLAHLKFLGCVQNPISNEPKHNGKDALK